MKKGFWIFLVSMLITMFTSCVYATNLSTLETDFAQGGNLTDKRCIIGSGQIYTGPCRILSVNFASATAGDKIGVYDTTDPSYPITDLEFEMTISSNTDSKPYYPNAPFVNGVRILSTNATSVTTITFDY